MKDQILLKMPRVKSTFEWADAKEAVKVRVALTKTFLDYFDQFLRFTLKTIKTISMVKLWLFLALLCLSASSACVRDSFASLPPLPLSPSTPYPGAYAPANSYVLDHWSEMALIGNYRPANTVVGVQKNYFLLQTRKVE